MVFVTYIVNMQMQIIFSDCVLENKKRGLGTKADKKSEKQKLIDGFNPEKYKKYNWKEKYNPVMDGCSW